MTSDEQLRAATEALPDRSEAFTHRVGGICATLSRSLSLPLKHDPDMEYAAAQQIVLWLDSRFAAVESQTRARLQVSALISSKGPFFMTLFRRLDQVDSEEASCRGLPRTGNCWVRADRHLLPREVEKSGAELENSLQMLGYHRIPERELSKSVPGKLTQLDGLPATIEQVLFSEMI